MTAEQEATIEKYRRLLNERWGIRVSARTADLLGQSLTADPDGFTAAQVIGGRE